MEKAGATKEDREVRPRLSRRPRLSTRREVVSTPRPRRVPGGARRRARFTLALAAALSLLGGACFEGESGEPFYGRITVPRAQEFRWSDGGLPQVFDPALASAPPDTDVVRALFEGLTDYEPRTLDPVPAVASRWESSEGGRSWTFYLRRDAYWSNGDQVTAHDFVRSWQRTLRLGESAPHAKLLANIEGSRAFAPGTAAPPQSNDAAPPPSPQAAPATEPTAAPPRFGAEAVDAHTLKITLERPDINFPALVSHPVFRPVHELSPSTSPAALREEQLRRGHDDTSHSIVTNGAFRLSEYGSDGVVLERAQHYWDASSVKLERVRFVATGGAEEALAAYRAGEVDAVTNAAFEPLAVKLLTPYRDFRRGTYGALTFYRINTARPPFDDIRVREALAVALDLERLSGDTLEGAAEPATKFLPTPTVGGAAGAAEDDDLNSVGGASSVGSGESHGSPPGAKRTRDAVPLRPDGERARLLLAEAGFPGGANFPRIRLLINRNEQQRQIAQAVARMWRRTLGVETEIVVRNWEDYEAMLRAGDYDVARRSVVMQTTDEETNMLALFAEATPDAAGDDSRGESGAPGAASPDPSASPAERAAAPAATPAAPPILTEAQALRELPAIPVYFASSYALVKPYVSGFDSNLLDAPSLKRVHIDTGWAPPPRAETIRVARAWPPPRRR